MGATRNREITFPAASRSSLLGKVETLTPERGTEYCRINQMEAFEVIFPFSPPSLSTTTNEHIQRASIQRFSEDINKVINEEQAHLPETELKIQSLEVYFKEEQLFLDKFATGDAEMQRI